MNEPATLRQEGSSLVAAALPAIVWIVHFMVVYLYGEAACALGWSEPSWLGLHGAAWVTLVATAVAVVVIGYSTGRSWLAYRRASDVTTSRSLPLVGLVNGPLFIAATLAVGLSALWVDAC